MEQHTFIRSESGSGIVNSDVIEYKKAVAKREQDKYIKGLEARIYKLESAMVLMQKTIKEISK
jgi:hypothetical protein